MSADDVAADDADENGSDVDAADDDGYDVGDDVLSAAYFSKPYSDETARVIDTEISLLIEGQYQRAITILEENKDKLNQLADILIEKEVIFKDDLEAIFGKRTFDANLEEIVS